MSFYVLNFSGQWTDNYENITSTPRLDFSVTKVDTQLRKDIMNKRNQLKTF